MHLHAFFCFKCDHASRPAVIVFPAIFNVVILIDTCTHLSPAKDFFSLFELQLLLPVALVLLLFNEKGVAKRENKVSKLALFQLCNQLLQFVMGKLTCLFFENCSRGFSRGRVKKNDCCHILSERLRNARELLGQLPTLMPVWRAENLSLTSSPVRPFTSFEAAQSSRPMRVSVPSKEKLATFSQFSTWCCSRMMTYSRGSLSANRYSVLL